ncbi:neutral zinc metallopeptidase [Euzebya rosea]|uniref:KPN_02809 family neutral zinc metallopeptidase n=1 Tax=Euzebya rosea TaxID=2052804 RepID=UPI000D3EA261|nr:neutral zinc metallopeptidase [Euzebya rosea]
MRWQRGRGMSSDIEDRRGQRVSTGTIAGGGGLIGVVVLIFSLLTGGGGGDLGAILEQLDVAAPAAPPQENVQAQAPDTVSEQDEFVSFVLDDVQNFWEASFADAGRTYDRSTLVLYTRGTDTAGCGYGQAAIGPFYCPADQKVYIDLSFFEDLATRFGAPGDFAQAYVIAHEIAHHVQNVLGISDQVRSQQQGASQAEANDLSIRLELQADCLSGVWAHSAYGRDALSPGDLEEGLGAAAAVGDDAIQSSAGAPVNPETWTHGSSEQRISWFNTGFETGDVNACDTFSGDL